MWRLYQFLAFTFLLIFMNNSVKAIPCPANNYLEIAGSVCHVLPTLSYVLGTGTYTIRDFIEIKWTFSDAIKDYTITYSLINPGMLLLSSLDTSLVDAAAIKYLNFYGTNLYLDNSYLSSGTVYTFRIKLETKYPAQFTDLLVTEDATITIGSIQEYVIGLQPVSIALGQFNIWLSDTIGDVISSITYSINIDGVTTTLSTEIDPTQKIQFTINSNTASIVYLTVVASNNLGVTTTLTTGRKCHSLCIGCTSDLDNSKCIACKPLTTYSSGDISNCAGIFTNINIRDVLLPTSY